MEQIGVFVVFLLVVLFNLIVQLLQRRRRARGGEAETAEAPPRLPPRLPQVPPRVVVAPPRLEEPPPAPIRVVPAVRPAPVRRRRRFDLRPGDLRRAVVLMTVLGPCRAQEEDERGVAGRP